ncbi:hypothetical protein Zmor_002130 [Zophobas morio]|uniref:Condensin-2 complex subunit H2 n=2 Tax=Zophobas morio TaxID=2755281 RepID=A0AA38MTE0_9CUCU|nr:hypothetical protein Zmor_002130 [Zophobas morio]
MSKNPNIEADLSQVLDDFLEKLGECDRYLENGIFNMNFAEAALLLQSSADVYSKKVDLLWDIIFDYQKRLLLSEEQNGDKNQEIEKVEERKRKYKRKRKTNSEENQTAKLVNNFSFGAVENVDYLNQDYETVDLSKEWDKFRRKDHLEDSLQTHTPNKNFIFSPNDAVYSEDVDYIGRYDQFHSMSLIDEIFHLQQQNLLTDEYNCVTKMRIDAYVVNDFLLERSIPSTKSADTYSEELQEYINNFFQSHRHPEKEASSSNVEQICRKSSVCLEKLPFRVIRDKMRRASLADSLFDDDHMTSLSEHCPSPCNSLDHDDPKDCEVDESFEQINKNLENRSKSCSQDSAFYEDVEDHGNEECEAEGDIAVYVIIEDPATGDVATNSDHNPETSDNVPAEEVVTAADNVPTEVSTPDCIATEEVPVREEISNTDISTSTEDVIANSTVSTVAEEVVKSAKASKSPIADNKSRSTVITRQKPVKRWSSLLQLQQGEDKAEHKRRKVQTTKRISEKALKKLSTGITAKYRDFEIFCRMQYKAAEGEGVVPAQLSDSDESEEEDNHMSDEDENDPTPVNTDAEMSDEECKNGEEEEEENDLETSPDKPDETPTSIRPNLPDPNVSPISTSHQPPRSLSEDRGVLGMTSTPHPPITTPRNVSTLSDMDFEQQEGYRKNVREWRSFIIPKLKTLENRADFDIHEYGARIIEPSEIGEQRYFKDIVKGKNAAEVARYFIATLQLANTYNVEITGAIPGGVANDNFQIKTLDKTKHHELLEEYQAPSEETFRERLQRVRAMSAKDRHSVDDKGPPVKKIKFSSGSRRSFF